MSSLNKVMLIGNVSIIEYKKSQSDKNWIFLSLATNYSYNVDNERKQYTEWHNVRIFNENTVKYVQNYCSKGNKVYVEGRLSTSKYQDNSGVTKYYTYINAREFIILNNSRLESDTNSNLSEKEDNKKHLENNASVNGDTGNDEDFSFDNDWPPF